MQLLPQKAVYIKSLRCILVSDIHLGKSETFQSFGISIPSQINDDNLERLLTLCQHYSPTQLFVLGDLFHSPAAMVPEVIECWVRFVQSANIEIHLILGNHDRPMVNDLANLLIQCHQDAIDLGDVILSHEPGDWGDRLTICGHLHPCVRLRTRLDDLRLPCFYLENQPPRLTLPSFGAFTGGYEVKLAHGRQAYAIAEDTVIPAEALHPVTDKKRVKR